MWNDEIHTLTPDGDQTHSGFEFYTDEIMQMSEIVDIHMVEIYEGDIITNYHGDIQVVEYSGCQWDARLIKRKTSFWPAQYLYCEYMMWEVVGNIHDNPEMIQDNHK